MNLNIFATNSSHIPANRCVVKLSTSAWSDKRGIHIRKSLTYLRRKCVGFNVLEEDAGAIGIEELVNGIVNLDDCSDGIYEVCVTDVSHDYETGYIDSYNLKLIPFKIA